MSQLLIDKAEPLPIFPSNPQGRSPVTVDVTLTVDRIARAHGILFIDIVSSSLRNTAVRYGETTRAAESITHCIVSRPTRRPAISSPKYSLTVAVGPVSASEGLHLTTQDHTTSSLGHYTTIPFANTIPE